MSVSRYYELELEKLNIEFENISLFTKHPTTIGNYREQVLKKYLRKFIPNNLTISSGFVYDFNTLVKNEIYQSQTKQVDCLIYDENIYTPFLKTEDFVIIEPDSLFAGIEVKSNLTFYKEYDRGNSIRSEKYPLLNEEGIPYKYSGTLIDSFYNIKSICNIAGPYKKNFFKGIFSYSSSINFQNLLFAFDNNELQKQIGYKHLDELPEYICIPNQAVIYFSRVPITEDEAKGFDPSQSEMTVVEILEKNKAFGLQFFTNALKISIDHNLSQKKPHTSGLFTAGLGAVKIWGHHFDLNSEYK